MRDAFRVPLAIAVGVLVVTAGAFGGVMFVDDDVHTLDGASDRVVSTADGQAVIVAVGVATAAGFVAGAVAHDQVTNEVNTSELERIDALETKISIHGGAATQKQNNEIVSDSFGNYLEDTQSIALMEGKNAYIKALNNGSTQSAAEIAATQAVSGYYAVKQEQLIASWNTSSTVANRSHNVAENTTGIDGSFIRSTTSGATSVIFQENETGTTTVSLVNGTTETALTLQLTFDGLDQETIIGPTTGDSQIGDSTSSRLIVQAPNENYEPLRFQDFSVYADRWTKIEEQNTDVQAQVDSFIDNTYDSYQEGTINNTDLVDPYLGAREYAPEGEFNSWALSSMASLGVEPPENLSSVGEMEVTDLENDVTYSGILMSQETPSGGYALNTTYNASEIGGMQMIVTEDENSHEFEGAFVVESATDADGDEFAQNESITYRNIEYNTTDTEDYQNLMQNLTELQAEVEAKQQQERNSGGGGGLFPGGLGSIGGVGGVALLAAAGGAFLLARD